MKLTSKTILANNKDPALVTGRLNVTDFVAARRAEIEKLQAALDSAGPAKQRAFQTVPRKLRRRTASHNPKRVPKRLRSRAIQEMAVDKPNVKKRRKTVEKEELDENKTEEQDDKMEVDSNVPKYVPEPNVLARPPKPRKYSKRQVDKFWLPTHIWHKKRAKLEQHWGYMVPMAPTQKQYRLTHRISDQLGGALVWDTSYYGTLITFGDQQTLLSVFGKVCPKSDAPLYLQGSRSWQGLLQTLGGQVIGPGLLLWQPGAVVLNLHPSIYEHVWNVIREISPSLQLYDCRFQLGSIDIIGSKALHTLVASLIPTEADAQSSKVWKTLGALANIDSMPYRSTLNVVVHDPRLSYPPNKQRILIPEDKIQNTIRNWPTQPKEIFSLWTQSGRDDVISKMSTIKELNARKKAGQSIEPNADDPSIPITAFKLDDSRVRVILPWGFVSAAWQSINHLPNVHIGGFKQFQQLAFERGNRCFPSDYPDTEAGKVFETEVALSERKAWDNRPSSKRLNFAREVGDPFTCDWSLVGKPEELKPIVVKTILRGTPQDRARIYSIPEGSEEAWLQTLKTPEMSDYPKCPSSEYLIGFVMSGNYNLSEASGFGVGLASVSTGRCLIRNIGTDLARVAELSETSNVVL